MHIRHGHFLFNSNDRFIGRALDLHGEWCESEIEALTKLVHSGYLVVDIFDSLGPPRCRLIKIDVEGMEPQVLLGGSDTIERPNRVIFVETTLVNGAKVIRIRTRRGYSCYWRVADGYNSDSWSRNSENVFSGIHPESNLRCIPRNTKVILGMERVTGPAYNCQLALKEIRRKSAS